MDRSKFKGGSLKGSKETRKEAEVASGYSGGSQFHSVEEGVNAFRVGPPHPGNERPYVPFRRSFIKCNAETYEGGEPTGNFEVKMKSIFVSTIHGGTEKDIIEVYCKYVYLTVKEITRDIKDTKKKEEREAELLFPIRGGKIRGKYQSGIQPSTSFMCYALKDGKWGLTELYSGWMKRIEELNIDEDGNEEAAVDRFSDPDIGVHLIITKKKKQKGEGWEYILSKRDFNPVKHKSWDKFIEDERITDTQLSQLLELPSLEEKYGPSVYRRKDFEMAVDGLQRIDEEHKYRIFENPDFIAELKEIEASIPEEIDDEPNSQEDNTSNEDSLNPDGEDFSSWGVPKLRKYIQEYIDTNYPGSTLPALQKIQLIEWAILVENEDDLPISDTTSGTDITSSEVEKGSDSHIEDTKTVEGSTTGSVTENTGSITEGAKSRIEKLKELKSKSK